MLLSEKKSQAIRGTDKVVGGEKEKDKSSFESTQEHCNVNSNIGIQSGVLSLSESSHSQKSEEKLTLFIPENKCLDGNFLQGVITSPSDAEIYLGKTLQCTSPSQSAKDKAINSPKALHPASVLLDDENAMFPDSSDPFSPSSLSSLSSSLQQSKPQSDACLSPLIMQQQASPGLSEISSPSVGRKKRIGSRNIKKTSTATDGNTSSACDPNAAGPLVLGNENNSTSSTSPAKQQDCPGPPLSGEHTI